MIIGNHSFIPVNLYDWAGDDMQITPMGIAVLCDLSAYEAYKAFTEVGEDGNLPASIRMTKNRRVKEYLALTADSNGHLSVDDSGVVASAIDHYAEQLGVMWL